MNRAIVGLLAAVLLAACGGGDGSDGTAECVATTDLTMVDNAFEPLCLEVAPDATLSITNEGTAIHSFTVESAGIDVDIQGGESGTAELGGVPTGETAFTCTFHPEMTGTLQVA